MKFSYYLPCYFTDKNKPAEELYREAEEQAQYAEELGYDAIVIAEHYFMNFLACPSILLFAVKVSQLVGLPIVSAVLPIPLYHPLRLAQEIAFADVLTGGRLEIGLGRGAFTHEFERLQISRDRNRAMFNECLDIMIKAWTSESDFSYEGEFYQFPGTTVLPKPLQKPHPPIWMSGQSDLSVQYAVSHGYNIMNTPLRSSFDALEDTYEVYTDTLKEYGKTTEDCKLLILRNTFVSEDREVLARQADNLHYNHEQFVTVYTGPSVVKDGMVEPQNVPFDPAEVFDNVISGDPEAVIRKLEQYRDLGIKHICLNMNFGGTHEEVKDSMRLFAETVMPCFQDEE
ncbi:MAG: LLM class flavin-dependent oxidoreductase [Chloroflexi bacterium]|nr:LLM class flavin-dependent oxidoreductase [Chloroflexota bacterium]